MSVFPPTDWDPFWVVSCLKPSLSLYWISVMGRWVHGLAVRCITLCLVCLKLFSSAFVNHSAEKNVFLVVISGATRRGRQSAAERHALPVWGRAILLYSLLRALFMGHRGGSFPLPRWVWRLHGEGPAAAESLWLIPISPFAVIFLLLHCLVLTKRLTICYCFNVHFKDMVNRRISMDMMLKIAASQRYRQFIFLTPQSMR